MVNGSCGVLWLMGGWCIDVEVNRMKGSFSCRMISSYSSNTVVFLSEEDFF